MLLAYKKPRVWSTTASSYKGPVQEQTPPSPDPNRRLKAASLRPPSRAAAAGSYQHHRTRKIRADEGSGGTQRLPQPCHRNYTLENHRPDENRVPAGTHGTVVEGATRRLSLAHQVRVRMLVDGRHVAAADDEKSPTTAAPRPGRPGACPRCRRCTQTFVLVQILLSHAARCDVCRRCR